MDREISKETQPKSTSRYTSADAERCRETQTQRGIEIHRKGKETQTWTMRDTDMETRMHR